MWDYMPFEVRRTFVSKDYRYMANFDWENLNRPKFDAATGKSLS